MFRPMRRKKQNLSREQAEAILINGSHGVLACLGDDDYPYAVPVNYTYHHQTIYFHSAKSGHKLDAIRKHPKVSFVVVDQDEIVPHEFTSYFRSALVFGKARLVEGPEQMEALHALVDKFSPGETPEAFDREVSSGLPAIVAITVEHLSGKEAIELVRARV